MSRERRQFERLELPEDAIATDESGRAVGKVEQASGGGMLIRTGSAAAAGLLKIGERLLIHVVEPASNNRHTVKVVVRYHKGEAVGVEFAKGEGKPS